MSSCVRYDWDDEQPVHRLNEKDLYPKVEKTKEHKCCSKELMLKMIELIDLSSRKYTNDMDCKSYHKLRKELLDLLS